MMTEPSYSGIWQCRSASLSCQRRHSRGFAQRGHRDQGRRLQDSLSSISEGFVRHRDGGKEETIPSEGTKGRKGVRGLKRRAGVEETNLPLWTASFAIWSAIGGFAARATAASTAPSRTLSVSNKSHTNPAASASSPLMGFPRRMVLMACSRDKDKSCQWVALVLSQVREAQGRNTERESRGVKLRSRKALTYTEFTQGSREALRAPSARDEAELDLWEGELSCMRGKDQVALTGMRIS